MTTHIQHYPQHYRRPRLYVLAITVCGLLVLSLPGLVAAQDGNAAPKVIKKDATGTNVVSVERRVIRKPVIGVLLATDDTSGVRIVGVTSEGAAAKAGIKSGDRLVSINGQEILGSTGELRLNNARKLIGALDARTVAKIGYQRGGRSTVVGLTPTLDEEVMVWKSDGGDTREFKGAVFIPGGSDHVFAFDTEDIEDTDAPGVAPQIHREIIRIPRHCKGEDCKAPMLMSAFRWNGLNLASVDKQLGRYFGTDRGVLVLSTGELEGLQTGDVIQSVDGKPVNSPRDVMATLHGKAADSKVRVEYLRDRKIGHGQITVPAMFEIPPPPAPPAPPPPPAPPAHPVPPTPPARTTGTGRERGGSKPGFSVARIDPSCLGQQHDHRRVKPAHRLSAARL